MNIWVYCGVFIGNFLADFMWAKYFQYVHLDDAGKAALWSGGIILAGGLTVISYKASDIYLLPAVVGGMWGTWVAIKSKGWGNGKPQAQAPKEPASRVPDVQAVEGQRCCN